MNEPNANRTYLPGTVRNVRSSAHKLHLPTMAPTQPFFYQKRPLTLLIRRPLLGLYTATGGAEFGPPPLGGPCGPPRTLRHAPAPLTRRWSSIFVGV